MKMTSIRTILPITAGLGVIALAAAVYTVPWGSVTADGDQPSAAAEDSSSVLKGADEIIGSLLIDTRAGTSPEKLLENSPLVILGRVVSAEIAEKPTEIPISKVPWPHGGPGTPAPGDDPKGGLPDSIVWGVYLTRYTIEVEDVIKSVDGTVPATINILTLGATVEGKEIAYEGIPIYRTGQRYVIFLTPNITRRPEGDFAELSGGYGAFLLEGGKVYRPLGDDGSWVPASQSDEAAFLDSLRAPTTTEQ